MEALIEMTVKIGLSLILGAMVGVEREMGKKPAGLRTHMLVSMGACLFTIVSMTSFGTDTARIAAGIVTGIGFIGAGSIIGSKERVRGITTAATLWITGAIGLAVGAGTYFPAIIAAVFVLIVLELGRIEWRR